jgi:putative transposase
VVKPADKKQVVTHLIECHRISERLACILAGFSRTAYRYLASSGADLELRVRVKALAVEYPRYGYQILHSLLKGEGLVVNLKRTHWVYTEESHQVRTKKRKKLGRPRLPMEVPLSINERYSTDFVSDHLSNGRRFRVPNIVDDYSREMVGQLVSVSITGNQVTRFLEELKEFRPFPKSIVCDNGTEYTSKAMLFCSKESGVKLSFI